MRGAGGDKERSGEANADVDATGDDAAEGGKRTESGAVVCVRVGLSAEGSRGESGESWEWLEAGGEGRPFGGSRTMLGGAETLDGPRECRFDCNLVRSQYGSKKAALTRYAW